MRFSLAASLVLLSLVSVLCFLATTKAEISAFILSLLILTLGPVVLTSLIIYGQGNLRAFAIGASIPMILLVFASQSLLVELSASPRDYSYQSLVDTRGTSSSGSPAYFYFWTFGQVASKAIKRTWSFGTLSLLGGFISLGLRAALQKPVASTSTKPPKSVD